MCVGIISIGNLKPKYILHSFTVSTLYVQNNFIRKRVTTLPVVAYKMFFL